MLRSVLFGFDDGFRKGVKTNKYIIRRILEYIPDLSGLAIGTIINEFEFPELGRLLTDELLRETVDKLIVELNTVGQTEYEFSGSSVTCARCGFINELSVAKGQELGPILQHVAAISKKKGSVSRKITGTQLRCIRCGRLIWVIFPVDPTQTYSGGYKDPDKI